MIRFHFSLLFKISKILYSKLWGVYICSEDAAYCFRINIMTLNWDNIIRTLSRNILIKSIQEKNSICSEGICKSFKHFKLYRLLYVLTSPNILSPFSASFYDFNFFPEFSSIFANKFYFSFLSLISNARTVTGSHTFCLKVKEIKNLVSCMIFECHIMYLINHCLMI